MIHSSQMVKVMNKRFAVLDEEMAKSFAVGALAAAAKASPSPKKTTTSTGRYLGSLVVSSRFVQRFDPGPLGSFSVPTKADALFGLVGRRPGDDVFLSAGVGYGSQVEFKWNYEVMQAGHNGGERQITRDQKRTIRKVGKTK